MLLDTCILYFYFTINYSFIFQYSGLKIIILLHIKNNNKLASQLK